MKIMLLLSTGIFCSVSAFAQGTVIFDNRVSTVAISHVYLPSPTSPGVVQIGNGPSDYPAGTTDWTGWNPVSGNGFSAQLFAAPGANIPRESLVPGFPITTFRTGLTAGFVDDVTATLTGVPRLAAVATIQMRVWDNQGGTILDWTIANAQPPGTELMGMSARINVAAIGSDTAPPPALVGLQSFNLTYNVPEPSPFTLVSIGALWLWLAWFRKCGNLLSNPCSKFDPEHTRSWGE